MWRGVLMIALLVGLAGVGGAGKLVRYGERFNADPEAIETPMIAHFAIAGWSIDPERRSGSDAPYRWLVFSKPGCPAPITVSILGQSRELRRLVELRHGGDVAFVERGLLVPHSDSGSTDPAGKEGEISLPLLAVSPADAGPDATCTLPL